MRVATFDAAPWIQRRVVRSGGSVAVWPAARLAPASRGSGAIGVDEPGIRTRVESARAGDADAFGELFRSFRTDVERLCARMLGSASEAEDAASETFLRAHRAIASYDPSRPFRAWLLSVCAHHCVDRLRRRATERRIFEPGAPDVEAVAAPGPSALSGVIRAEARSELRAAIDALPVRYRAPLVLRYLGDFDYDEIAATLEVSRGQVATLLFRAKRRLREGWSGAAAEGSA